MPRDISGTYTLPLAPIEPRRIPVVNWVNPTVEDIAAALNNIPGDALAPGSVGTTQLEDNSVTNAKLVPHLKPEQLSIMGEGDGFAVLNIRGDTYGTRMGYLACLPDDSLELSNESGGGVVIANSDPDVPTVVTGRELRVGGRATSGGGDWSVVTFGRGSAAAVPGGAYGYVGRGNPLGDSEAIYLDSYAGRVALGGTDVYLLNGKLRFPPTQSPSADPNTLDDYEEGSWTPTFVLDGGVTAGLSISSYDVQSGRYVKVGRQVWFWFSMSCIATHTDSYSWAGVGGLPFTASAVLPYYPVSGYCENYYNIGAALYGAAQGLAVNSTNTITLYIQGAGPTSNIGTTYLRHVSGEQVYVYMSGSYICDN